MATFTFDVVTNVMVPAVLGGTGGFLYVLYKYKGDLEMPTYRRLKTKTVLRLGFLYDVFLGAGAGAVAANVCYALNAMPPDLVAGIVAVFAGLAGGKYLFKRKGDTRDLNSEVNNLLDFMSRQGNNSDDNDD